MDCILPGSSVYSISHARILEWVAIPFSRGSSPPRDWTQVFCIAGRFFTVWATWENQYLNKLLLKTNKKTQRSQINEFIIFLLWENVRLWAHWNHSFDIHLSYLGPVCFPACIPLRFTLRQRQWLSSCNILCLPIWQATFLIQKAVPFSTGKTFLIFGILSGMIFLLFFTWTVSSNPSSLILNFIWVRRNSLFTLFKSLILSFSPFLYLAPFLFI